MNNIKTDFIEKVIEIMKHGELTEVTLEDNDSSLYIKTDGVSYSVEVEDEKEEKLEEKKEEAENVENKKLVPIVSNMIGLYFSKPSPNEKPFVQVGDRVKEGQQICIIETIKLMNKIVSEVSGTVKEICVEDRRPIEYGQTIMYIEQD